MLSSKRLALACVALAAVNAIWQRPGADSGLTARVAASVATPNASYPATTYNGEYGQVFSLLQTSEDPVVVQPYSQNTDSGGVVLPYSQIQTCHADATDDTLPGQFQYTNDNMPTFLITAQTQSEILVGPELQRVVTEAGSTDNAGWPYVDSSGKTVWDEFGQITPEEQTISVIKSAANIGAETYDEVFNSKDFHANERGCELKWRVLDKAKPVIYDSSTDKPAQICEKNSGKTAQDKGTTKSSLWQHKQDIDFLKDLAAPGVMCTAKVELASAADGTSPLHGIIAKDFQEVSDDGTQTFPRTLYKQSDPNSDISTKITVRNVGGVGVRPRTPSAPLKEDVAMPEFGSVQEYDFSIITSEMTPTEGLTACMQFCREAGDSNRTAVGYMYIHISASGGCGCSQFLQHYPLKQEIGSKVYYQEEPLVLVDYGDADLDGNSDNVISLASNGEMIIYPGKYEITFAVKDKSENEASCTFNYTVPTPNTKPTLRAEPAMAPTAIAAMIASDVMREAAMAKGEPLPEKSSLENILAPGSSLGYHDNPNPKYKFAMHTPMSIDFKVGIESTCGVNWEAWNPNTGEDGELYIGHDSSPLTVQKFEADVKARAVEVYNMFAENKDVLARGFVETPAVCNPWVKVAEPMRRCALSAENGLLAESDTAITGAVECQLWCSQQFKKNYDDYAAFDGSLKCGPNSVDCLGTNVANNPLWCSHGSNGQCQVSTNCWKKGMLNNDNETQTYTNYVGAYLNPSTWGKYAQQNQRKVTGYFTSTTFKNPLDITKDEYVTFLPECWFDSLETGHLQMSEYKIQVIENPLEDVIFTKCSGGDQVAIIDLKRDEDGALVKDTLNNYMTSYMGIMCNTDNITSDGSCSAPVERNFTEESLFPSYPLSDFVFMINTSTHKLTDTFGAASLSLNYYLENQIGSVSDVMCTVSIRLVEPPVTCPFGFVVDTNGDTPTCVDVDECAAGVANDCATAADNSTATMAAACVNTQGSYMCHCPLGYWGGWEDLVVAGLYRQGSAIMFTTGYSDYAMDKVVLRTGEGYTNMTLYIEEIYTSGAATGKLLNRDVGALPKGNLFAAWVRPSGKTCFDFNECGAIAEGGIAGHDDQSPTRAGVNIKPTMGTLEAWEKNQKDQADEDDFYAAPFSLTFDDEATTAILFSAREADSTGPRNFGELSGWGQQVPSTGGAKRDTFWEGRDTASETNPAGRVFEWFSPEGVTSLDMSTSDVWVPNDCRFAQVGASDSGHVAHCTNTPGSYHCYACQQGYIPVNAAGSSAPFELITSSVKYLTAEVPRPNGDSADPSAAHSEAIYTFTEALFAAGARGVDARASLVSSKEVSTLKYLQAKNTTLADWASTMCAPINACETRFGFDSDANAAIPGVQAIKGETCGANTCTNMAVGDKFKDFIDSGNPADYGVVYKYESNANIPRPANAPSDYEYFAGMPNFECECGTGYTKFDGNFNTITVCIDVDACRYDFSTMSYFDQAPDLCGENGMCADAAAPKPATEYTCTCKDGWYGPDCDIETNSCKYANGSQTGVCGDNAVCEKLEDSNSSDYNYTCKCDMGFVHTDPAVPQTGCSDRDECTQDKNGKVMNTSAGETVFADCDDLRAICTNTVGSYTCACDDKRGYQQDGFSPQGAPEAAQKGDGKVCEDIPYCAEEFQVNGSMYNQCDDRTYPVTVGKAMFDKIRGRCTQQATPLSYPDNGYKCSCRDTIGFKCDAEPTCHQCDDIDECTSEETNLCDDKAECTNTNGSYYCTCPAYEFGVYEFGYHDDMEYAEGQKCLDTIECSALWPGRADGNANELTGNSCSGNATCADADGSYTCVCRDGYAGDGVECEKEALTWHNCPEDHSCSTGEFYKYVAVDWEPPYFGHQNGDALELSKFNLTTPKAKPGTAFTPGYYTLQYSATVLKDKTLDTSICEFTIFIDDPVKPKFGGTEAGIPYAQGEEVSPASKVLCPKDNSLIGVDWHKPCGGKMLDVRFDDATRTNEILGYTDVTSADCCGTDTTCVPLLSSSNGDNKDQLHVCTWSADPDNGGATCKLPKPDDVGGL